MDTLNENDNTSEDKSKQLDIQYIQPWSNFIVKLKLPEHLFNDLQKMYEDANKENISFGKELVGQIDNEPQVTPELMKKYKELITFFLQSVQQYVTATLHQSHIGDGNKEVLQQTLNERLLARITTMWFVNQKPGEYNPSHIHTNCKISAVMYLKKPSRQIKDRKEHYKSDGMITFMNNTGTDSAFTNSQCSFNPEPGTMFLFPALQHHMVWPYRSEDPNDSRISLSFNADFTTEERLKAEQNNAELMYKEMKKMKESENDKSVTDGNINKSG